MVRFREGRKFHNLHPDTFTSNNLFAEVANAIDGRTSKGNSGKVTVLNGALTKHNGRRRQLQIDLQRPYSISAIRLHLRDGEQRQKWQKRLVVCVSNSTIATGQVSVGIQCGKEYLASTSGQSPLFPCWTSGRYVYAVLRNSFYPIQVCKMQIFKGLSSGVIRV